MATSSIATQVGTFNADFTRKIGPSLSGVFNREQAELSQVGTPGEAVSVGDKLPDAKLTGADGTAVTLFEFLGTGSTVLVFYRGAWCPYCNITLRTYQQELLPLLQQRGDTLIAISPQTADRSAAAVDGGELQFAVLSDEGNLLAQQLGIVTAPSAQARAAHTELGFDVADSDADSTAAIPFPTVLIVDASGVVRFVDVHVDYTTRTEVADIVEALSSRG
ncbi:peroxiredoxin-like family protein [Arthrobacter sp. Br18]|uniref:peroxiredoxin-like family protein n=1 Tax=Arthrobacter sp. Br18 TaxID=1312954 RepID=UPI0004AF171A|nr:peroxiredoxin-like family protein [Arthrobacter sp. Br18]